MQVHGQAGYTDHLLPILFYHLTLLSINKMAWSNYSGEGWSMRAFFPGMINKHMKTKQVIEMQLIEKAMKDPDFRKRLLENPKAVIQEMTGFELSPSLNLRILEEDPHTVYLILPFIPSQLNENELDETELERIAGGGQFTGFSFCHTCGCDSFTRECE